MLDVLPAAGLDEDSAVHAYQGEVGPAAPGWRALDAAHRGEAVDAWRDAYQAAVLDQVARHCRGTVGLGEGDGGGAEDDPRGDR